jgi:hypothetical protein
MLLKAVRFHGNNSDERWLFKGESSFIQRISVQQILWAAGCPFGRNQIGLGNEIDH